MNFIWIFSNIILLLIKIARGTFYSQEVSVEYLLYSKASYCPTQNIESWMLDQISEIYPQMSDIITNFNQSSNGLSYVGYNNNQIILVFRGTEADSLKNWFYNAFFYMTEFDKCENCRVHGGFQLLYESLRPKMIQDIEFMIKKYPYAPIIITGHSLGGALSNLAAIDIQQLLLEKSYPNILKQVHTFGQPRVGNPAFADFYNKLIPQTIRVVNDGDLVAHVTPIIFGYSHVGTEVWFDASTNSIKICSPSEIENCSMSISYLHLNDHLNYFGYHTGCDIPEERLFFSNDGLKETIKNIQFYKTLQQSVQK